MPTLGARFGIAVALGVLGVRTVLPLSPVQAGVVTTLAIAGAGAWRPAWVLIPAALGALRATTARAAWNERVVRSPQRAEGVVTFGRRTGRQRIVSVDGRRALLPDSTGTLPGAGSAAPVQLRLDPLRGRAEASAFDVTAWARARGIHGRARLLGSVGEAGAAGGPRAVVDRAVERIRDRARERLGAGRSPARDLVVALTLGDRRGLRDPHLEAFRHAGLAHVLALSGMHVGILALGFGAMARSARWPSPLVVAATVAFVFGFAVLTGGAAPILRACGTGSLALLGRALGRRGAPVHAVGLIGGGLLLVRPELVGDVGFRLSFLAAGTLAIAAASAPAVSGGSRAIRAWRGIREAVAVSTFVTIATTPEILSSFGTVSLLSPLTNLLATLPATLALGWGALAAFAPLPGVVTDRFAASAALAAQGLLALAQLSERIPGGDVRIAAPGPGLAGAIVGGAWFLAARRRPGSRSLAAFVALAATDAAPVHRATYFDVGQGDAALLETPAAAVLVDAGPLPWGGGEPPAAPALRHRRTRAVDVTLVTHAHQDHAGGAAPLLEEGRVRTLALRDPPHPEALTRLRRVAGESGVPVRGPADVRRRHLRAGLPPPDLDSTDENDHSAWLRWASPVGPFLWLGDGTSRSEAALLEAGSPAIAPARVVLLPHHGARESSSPALLDAVRPTLAVVSCGARNPHGHPHPETRARLVARGIPWLRTDRDGTVQLTVSAHGLRVRWSRDFPSAPARAGPFRLPVPRGIS